LDNPIHIHQLFPKIIARTKLGLSQEQEINLVDIYNKTEFVKTKPNIKNEVSMSSSLDVISDIQFLKEKILKVFNSYKNNFLKLNNTDFKITSSWFTKSKANQNNNFHKHSNNDFSMVYYFNNYGDVRLTFEDFNPGHNRELIPTEELDHNVVSKTFELKNDELIIFPSELYHKIESFEGHDIRKSLALNLTAIGEFGFGDSKINVK
tara:strand:- start:48 stop:668 length:621 start_codon:yes stop_codon:yes gene_type:complete